MIAHRNFEGCEPLTWVGKVPVYLSTAIAAGLGVAMVVTAVLMASAGSILINPILRTLSFSSEDVIGHFSLWQFGTYFLVNPPGFWEALQLLMLAMFGREVEKFIGRNAFAVFYGVVVLSIPAFLALMALIFKSQSFYFGSGTVNFAVFAAFVVIYPRAEIFFGIEARWILVALLGINSLILLSVNAWVELGMMWWVCLLAALWMKREGVMTIPLPSFRLPRLRRSLRRQPRLRVVRRPDEEEAGLPESVDAILDKISRHGIESLTRAERDRLEKARAALLEKERPR